MTIYGKGDQTRSFQYVDDLVEGLIRLMNGNYSQPVNIGNPAEYKVRVSILYTYTHCIHSAYILSMDKNFMFIQRTPFMHILRYTKYMGRSLICIFSYVT